MNRISITIDRLVLRGIPKDQQRAFTRAMKHSLQTSLLKQSRQTNSRINGVALPERANQPRLNAGQVRVSPGLPGNRSARLEARLEARVQDRLEERAEARVRAIRMGRAVGRRLAEQIGS